MLPMHAISMRRDGDSVGAEYSLSKTAPTISSIFPPPTAYRLAIPPPLIPLLIGHVEICQCQVAVGHKPVLPIRNALIVEKYGAGLTGADQCMVGEIHQVTVMGRDHDAAQLAMLQRGLCLVRSLGHTVPRTVYVCRFSIFNIGSFAHGGGFGS